MAERVCCLYRGRNQNDILIQKNTCRDFSKKKGWTIVGEEQEITTITTEVALPPMKKSTVSGNLLSKANLTSCWSLCLIGLGIVPMKYRLFWSGLPRKASVFGAPVREKTNPISVQNGCLAIYVSGRTIRFKNLEQWDRSTPHPAILIFLRRLSISLAILAVV